jgi:type I restriction enzyme S subunit
MSFPRYATYKDSGVEWLGQVPEHWRVVPLKHLAEFINGDAFKPTEWAESGVPIIRIQNLNGSEDFNYYNGEVEQRYLVHDGDLLFGWSGNRGTSFGPFLWSRSEVCALNQHIFRVVPNSTEKRLLFWTLKAVTAHVEDQAHGIIGMVHVTKGDLGAINVPVPPLPEQTQIAAFLDRETAKIDVLVAEQRRLMALLKEKRQAVISHAVTRGLNPDAPMKPSGIEWLGEVPRHWAVTRIKRLTTSFEQGWSPQCEGYPVMTELEWGVLKVGCVNGGTFRPDENKTLPQELEPIPSLGISAGDLLISRANTRELVGSAAVAQRDYSNLLLCDKLYRLRFQRNVCSPVFIALYLCTGMVRGQIELSATGASSSMVNIAQSTILELDIALPDFYEQQAITAFLESEAARFDTLTAEAERAIDLLQERRTALISAAVTGQIDVRSAA